MAHRGRAREPGPAVHAGRSGHHAHHADEGGRSGRVAREAHHARRGAETDRGQAVLTHPGSGHRDWGFESRIPTSESRFWVSNRVMKRLAVVLLAVSALTACSRPVDPSQDITKLLAVTDVKTGYF